MFNVGDRVSFSESRYDIHDPVVSALQLLEQEDMADEIREGMLAVLSILRKGCEPASAEDQAAMLAEEERCLV